MRVGSILVCMMVVLVATAVAFPLPQAVVAVYVETVILPAYSGTIFSAMERLTKECPRMFSRATMQQITCEQFMRTVRQGQFAVFFLIGGRPEYTFVTTDYAADRNSAIVAVQITRRDSRGRVERQWLQTFSTVLEDGAWRIQLEDRLIAAVKGTSPAASPTPPSGTRTLALSARATAGPIAVAVTSVEFARELTSLVVSIENAADIETNLFNAISDARLVDNTGKTYAVRVLRSDLPDRVPPRSSVRGRLVFEPLPLPPTVRSATLTLPGVSVGDAAYDITLELRF